jgi:hypothetical protein
VATTFDRLAEAYADNWAAHCSARSQLPIGPTGTSEELPIDSSRSVNHPDCCQMIRALRRNATWLALKSEAVLIPVGVAD